MDPEKKEPTGFEALLHQNEIAEAQEKAANPQASIEERIRASAPAPKNSVVRNIRTLKDDIAENVSKGNVTVVSVASALNIAPQSKGVNVVVSKEQREGLTRWILIALAVILIVSGAGGLGYVFFLRSNSSVTINERSPLIFAEKSIVIDTTSIKPADVRKRFVSERDKANEQLGTMVSLVFTKAATTSDGKMSALDLSTDDLFRSLVLSPPSRFIRSLDQKYMIGVHIFDGNQPFFIFKPTLYESAFAGMLDWEKTITQDFGPLLRSPTDFIVQQPLAIVATTTNSKNSKVATSTATTTPIAVTPITLSFEDQVYKNIDTRVLKDQKGKILIVYAFISRDTLVITSNLQTLGEIMSRLTTRQVVQ